MRLRRVVACVLVCLVAVGCASTGPKPAKPIHVKHHKTYPREKRFWAGESGDVQGFVLPMVLVSPKKNQLLQEATKGEYTLFIVAAHNKTSNEALPEDKATPEVRVTIHDMPVANVDGLAVIGPLIMNRLNELSAERNRLALEFGTGEAAPAPAAPPAAAPEGAAPAPKAPGTREELAKVEAAINTLSSIRAYLRLGRLDTKRGIVWYQIVAIPGKEDIAAIQGVQWGCGGGALVDMQEYGYKYDMMDKLKLKDISERPVPGFLPTFVKNWLEE